MASSEAGGATSGFVWGNLSPASSIPTAGPDVTMSADSNLEVSSRVSKF